MAVSLVFSMMFGGLSLSTANADPRAELVSNPTSVRAVPTANGRVTVTFKRGHNAINSGVYIYGVNNSVSKQVIRVYSNLWSNLTCIKF